MSNNKLVTWPIFEITVKLSKKDFGKMKSIFSKFFDSSKGIEEYIYVFCKGINKSKKIKIK